MLPRSPIVLSLLACLALSSLTTAGEAASHAAWLGQDTVAVLEITQPRQVLDHLFSAPVKRAVTGSPLYAPVLADSKMQELLNVVKYFENQQQADLPTLLRKLAGGGVTIAVGPRETVLAIVEAEDAATLRSVHEFALLAARSEAQKLGVPDRVKSAEYRGITGWSFAPNEAHAIVDNRLLITNRPDALKELLDRRAGDGGPSLADSEAYQAACQAAGNEPLVRAFVDLATIKQLPNVKKGLSGDENPLGVLLVAPLLAALRESNWAAAALSVDGDVVELAVHTSAGALPAGSSDEFAIPKAANGILPNLNVPRQIAAISLYRDLHAFYAAKDQLFPNRTSGLIFFENMMGIFFTGRDLTEEVLAETQPDVRFVVAEQEFDASIGAPKPQFPAFALVLRLRDPEKFRPVAEEAWQKAIGLVNFTRGQQALPGLIIDRPTHEGERYTVASFGPPTEADKSAVDVRFNFQPALAMPGSYLILSSTGGLAKDLIAAAMQEQQAGAKSQSQTHSSLELRGTQLASILRANREQMIAQNMVEKGNTREQAEGELGMLFTLLDYVPWLRLKADTRESGSTLTLELQVDLP